MENQDLAAFAVANARITENSVLQLSRIDHQVCGAVEAADLLFRLCDSFSESVRGGGYGTQVYDLIGFPRKYSHAKCVLARNTSWKTS